MHAEAQKKHVQNPLKKPWQMPIHSDAQASCLAARLQTAAAPQPLITNQHGVQNVQLACGSRSPCCQDSPDNNTKPYNPLVIPQCKHMPLRM